MKNLILIALVFSVVGCGSKKRGQQITARKTDQQQAPAKPAADATSPAQDQSAGKPEAKGSATKDQVKKDETTGSAKSLPVAAVKPAPEAKKPVVVSSPQTAQTSKDKSVVSQMTFVDLDFDETYSTLTILGKYFGQNSEGMMSPILAIGTRIEEYSYELTGSFEKADLSLKKKDQEVVKFSDVQLNLKEPIRGQQGNYILVASCIGAECEIVSASIFQKAGEKVSENIPVLFKKVEGVYKPAKFMEMKAFAAELESKQKDAQDPAKAPPQMKVAYLLATNTNKHQVSVLSQIRKQMKDQNHIYSARLFTNMKSRSCDPEIKFENSKVSFVNSCEFIELESRKAIVFNGSLLPDLTNLVSTEGMKLSIATIKEETDLVKGTGFYLLTYLNENFKSPIANTKSAIQSRLCQVLVEKDVSYTECEFVPSSVVLDAMVLEGHFDGPFYNGDTFKLENGKTISEPTILKNRTELPKKAAPAATDGV